MAASDRSETEFRKQLVAAINTAKASFNFSEFVAANGMPREAADRVAEKMVAQLFVRSLKDGVITEKERARTSNIARRLEISPERQKEICDRAGKSKYRAERAAAQADGVVTSEERAALQQLMGELLGSGKDRTELDTRRQTPNASSSPPNASSSPGTSFDEGKFRKTRRYHVNASAESVLADMAFLREFDRGHEQRSRSWMIVGFVGVACLIVALICFVADDSYRRGALSNVAAVAAVAGLASVLVGFILSARHRVLDLDDRRYEIVFGILSLLSRDMAKDAPVTVKIDFRPHNHARKFVRKGQVGHWKAKFFVDRWLEIRGNFADGTKYSVAMIEKQQDRSRWKRSRSGKLKHKSKTKRASEAIVRLKIKQKRYPKAQTMYKDIKQTMKLPAWVRFKSFKAQGDQMMLRTATKSTWGVEKKRRGKQSRDGVNWIAMMFLSAYRLLNAAK